jgi:serine/threonine protein kinase
VGKGQEAVLKHGSELSLGVKSAGAAKKTNNHKDSFVSFIFKANFGEVEETDVHPAFTETAGPQQSYTCAKELGSGAFAEVRLCFHKKSGQKYAAKIVDKNKFALNKELRKGSFRDEVEILKSIRSPYIVRVEDIFETDNYLTIILQYVSGGDLFDTLIAKKRYSEAEAKIVFLQMAQGVKYLHERGIAHRDLKFDSSFLSL